MKDLKKIISLAIILLFLGTAIVPKFNAQVLNLNSSIDNSKESISVVCHLKDQIGRTRIESTLTTYELEKLRETLNETQKAILTIYSNGAAEKEKTNAYNVLKKSFLELNQFELLPNEIKEQDFINLVTGVINNEKHKKFIEFFTRLLEFKSKFKRNSEGDLTEGIAIVGWGSNVRTSFYFNAFSPLIAFIGNNIAEKIWGMPEELAQAFFLYLLMWVPMIRGMIGVMNVFSNIWEDHNISGLFGDPDDGKLNTGNFSNSFFIFSMGLWIEIPLQYCDKYPFYESEWFFAGFAAWVGTEIQ
ncbi:MAG: hypothetical protein KAW45_03795 [Thermoplasmatales archaeon]|nr:hypothetical protein [Thermoplasmatales archaeon]